MRSKLLVSATTLLCLSVLAPAALAAKYKVGDRVQVDPMHIGIWKGGTVTEVLAFDRYRVQIDEEVGKYEPTVMLEQYMKAGAGTAPAAPGGSAPAAGANTPPAAAAVTSQQGFAVGQRVMADATGIGMGKPGTITEMLGFGRFRVQFDDEIGKYGPTVILIKNMKAGGAPPVPSPQTIAQQPTAAPPAAMPVNRAAALAVAPQAAPVRPRQPAPTPRDEHAGTADSPEWHQAGKGKPPDGIYECDKIGAGGYAGLGNLQIRGNTYKGIGDEGGFHPFSLGANGRITWSDGLHVLPDSWQIKHSFYYGPDYQGHPLIKIYYRSKAGWNDCIDCTKRR